MKLSRFGHQLTSDSAIVDLMEDLGDALNVNPDILFLGGGNPAHIPEFETVVAQHLCAIARDPAQLHKLIGVYQSPQGAEDFVAVLTAELRNRFGWKLSANNIALAGGSQSAFFILLNMFAGPRVDAAGTDSTGRICFPIMPEYLGYADQGVADDLFVGFRPLIEETAARRFKYRIDFDTFTLDPSVAALCLSRPTNPSGNIVTREELEKVSALARAQAIPLIIDCAYGLPFPGVVYRDAAIEWQTDHIFVLSLSKLGLPGARTGIVIAREDIIEQFVKINTILSLANGNLGPALMTSLLRAGDLFPLCTDTLLPYYRRKRDVAIACVEKYLADLPYKLHEPEGAFFLWLWLRDLPISSRELYQRMKEKNVLIMAGEHFFFGLPTPWDHARQCIRLTYCQHEGVIEQAIRLLAETLKEIYG